MVCASACIVSNGDLASTIDAAAGMGYRILPSVVLGWRAAGGAIGRTVAALVCATANAGGACRACGDQRAGENGRFLHHAAGRPAAPDMAVAGPSRTIIRDDIVASRADTHHLSRWCGLFVSDPVFYPVAGDAVAVGVPVMVLHGANRFSAGFTARAVASGDRYIDGYCRADHGFVYCRAAGVDRVHPRLYAATAKDCPYR